MWNIKRTNFHSSKDISKVKNFIKNGEFPRSRSQGKNVRAHKKDLLYKTHKKDLLRKKKSCEMSKALGLTVQKLLARSQFSENRTQKYSREI